MKAIACLFFAVAVAFTSCKTTCYSTGGIDLYFQGFDSSDAALVVIGEYQPGTNFAAVNRTIVLSSSPVRGTDTFSFFLSAHSPTNVSINEADILVQFPAINKTYKITGFHINHDKENTKECTSSYSYYRNDSLVSMPISPWGNNGFSIVVYK